MVYERQVVIFHMVPYDLHDTIVHCYDIYNRQNEEGYQIDIEVLDNVIAQLYDLKYLVMYTDDDLIPDLRDGVLLNMDTFFRRYGQVDQRFPVDPISVIDFPVGDIEMQAIDEGESVITDEEEDDLVVLSHIYHMECTSSSDSDDSTYVPPTE
jgi:hypothetical protein